MMYRWNFSDIARQINELQYGPYVPSCERHPYYDDPRDVKQDLNEHIAQFAEGINNTFVHNFLNYVNNQSEPYSTCCCGDQSSTDQPKEVQLVQCQKCGTYFQPIGMVMFCEECRKSQ